MWKNRKLEYFLAITGHFFDKNYEYKEVMCSFRKFYGRHTSQNITQYINDQLLYLNILDKVVAITTDNEASVVSACTKLGENVLRISCMCHNLNLVVKNSLNLSKNPKK